MSSIGTLTIEMAANLARLSSDMAQAKREVGSAMEGIKNSAETAKKALELLGIAVGVGAFVEGIKSTIEFAHQLETLSQRVGVSVQDLVGFKLAAAETGTSLDAVAMGIKKLSSFMVQHDDLMQRAGITATNASDALLQLSDIFHAMPDGVQKTALAVQLFGRNGIEMIPMLNEGSAKLEEQRQKAQALAEQYEKLAPNAKALNEELQTLKMYSEAAAVAIGSVLAPEVKNLIEQFLEGQKISGGFLESIRLFGWGISPFASLSENLKSVRAELDKLQQDKAGADAYTRNTVDFDKLIADATKKLQFLELQQRQAALAGQVPYRDEGATGAPAGMTAAQADAAAKALLIIKQAKDGYDALVKSIQEKIALDRAQLATDVPLTEAQKLAVKVNTDLNDGTLKFTATQKAKVQALLAEYLQVDQNLTANQLALKMAEDLGKAGDTEIDRLKKLVEAQALHNDTIGKTKEQIELAKRAADDAATQQMANDAQAIQDALQKNEITGQAAVIYEAYLAKLQQEIIYRQQLSGLLQQGAVLEKADETTKLLQQDFKRFADGAENDIENAILNGGTKGGQSLIQKLEHDFAAMALHVVIQATVNGTVGNLVNAASGGNIMSTAGGASSLFSNVSDLAGLASLPSLGTAVSNLSTIIPTFSTMIESGAGIVDSAAAAFAGTASSFAAVVPWVGAALAVYSLLSSGGGEDPHNNPDSKYIVGHFGINGASPAGGNLANITMGQTSGSGRWADYSALSSDQLDALNKGTAAVFASGQSLAKILGVDASALNDVAVEGERFTGVPDVLSQLWTNIATTLIPTISTLAQGGETIDQTLARVTGDIQTLDAATGRLGMSLNLTGTAAERAQQVENIIAAGGGSQAFGAGLQTFYSTFYSTAEQLANAQADLNKQFAALGVAVPASNDAFRALVTGIDLSTTAGQVLFGQLIAIAPAFAQLTAGSAAAAKAISDQAIADANAAAKLQAQQNTLTEDLLTAQGNDAAATALKRQDILAGLDPTLLALQKQVWAAQDAAAQATLDAQNKAAADQLAAQAASQAAAAAQQLTSAWQSATDSVEAEIQKIRGLMGTPGQTVATAQMQFALAVAAAKAGDQSAAGSLPGLADALLTVAGQRAGSALALAQLQAQILGALQGVAGVAGTRYGVKLPGFASGTDYLPHDGALYGHQGERITPAAYNRSDATNADLLAEMRAMRAEIEAMRGGMDITAKATYDSNYRLKRLMPDNRALVTTT